VVIKNCDALRGGYDFLLFFGLAALFVVKISSRGSFVHKESDEDSEERSY
jgi:hypothetical protein